MKKIFFVTLISLFYLSLFNLSAQTDRVGQLQSLEQNQSGNQNIIGTATLKSASRLFASQNDLTSVIMIIPADSVVDVLGSDSTYLHVVYQDNEGFIFKRQAVIDKMPARSMTQQQQQTSAQSNQQAGDEQDRFTYLENKYGTNMANRLITGKIWKGMNAEMVNDSWGTADKINRIISSNIVKEEWIYRSTWLYFENNTLLEWGPVKKQ
jgi:hypothetical protein